MSLPPVAEQSGFPPCVHLSIQFNQHAVYYDTAEKWLADQQDGDRCWFTWVSDEERQQALDTDSIWTCQWYPDTPVGFCALAAASFETLMAAVLAAGKR